MQLASAARLDVCDCVGTGKISIDEGSGKKYVFAATAGGTLNIYGGNVEGGTVRTCVTSQGGSTVNLYGGTFKSNKVNLAVLYANGGTINVAGRNVTISGNSGGMGTVRTGTTSGSAINISAGTVISGGAVIYAASGTVSVTGGSLKGTFGFASGATATITLSGGKFSTEPAAAYIKAGYTVKSTGNTTYPYGVVVSD